MHVLLIPSWYETPAFPVRGIFFKHQALALAAAGHRVGIVYPELRSIHTLHRGRARIGFQSHLEGLVRTYRHYGFRLPRQPARFRRRWTDMATHLARRYVGDHGTPDVVHAHSAVFAGEVAADLGRELGVPYVLTEHSSRYLSGTLTALQKSCTVDSLAAAGAVIAVSHRLKAALHHLVDRGDIQVVPNMVDTKRFAPPPGSRDGQTFRFVCIAALGPNKNVPLLIRAFHRAFPETEFVALEIVGEGRERPRLQGLVRAMNEGHRIAFHGAADTDGVVNALARSHCCVSASNFETFGVTLIEAMASGLPVVATRSGGPEDIVTPECGYLVPVGDEPALASAMRRVYFDRVYWAYRSSLLSEYARRTYGPEAIVSSLETVYRSL